MRRFSWPGALLTLSLGVMLVGGWLFSLASISMATISRESLVLFMPSESLLALFTFAMLGGLAIISIQIAAMVEELTKATK